MANIDTDKVRESAQKLMQQSGELLNVAHRLPSIVEEVATNQYMQQFANQTREAAITAGATQDAFTQIALQMIAYADRVDRGG